MKAYFTILLFLFLSKVNFAQCEFLVDEFDRFENHYKRITDDVLLVRNYNLGSLNASFAKSDSMSFFIITHNLYPGAHLFTVDTSNTLIFLTNEGRLIYKPLEKSISDYKASGNYTSLRCFYELDSAKINSFLNLKLTEVRFNYNEGYSEGIIKEKDLNKFKESLRCFLNAPLPQKK